MKTVKLTKAELGTIEIMGQGWKCYKGAKVRKINSEGVWRLFEYVREIPEKEAGVSGNWEITISLIEVV